jgi:hypothetical protein
VTLVKSGSLAKFAAILRASSLVSKVEIRERLAVLVADDEAGAFSKWEQA